MSAFLSRSMVGNVSDISFFSTLRRSLLLRCVVLIGSVNSIAGLTAQQGRIVPDGTHDVSEKVTIPVIRREAPPEQRFAVGATIMAAISTVHDEKQNASANLTSVKTSAHHNSTARLSAQQKQMKRMRRKCRIDPATGWCKLRRHRAMKCKSLNGTIAVGRTIPNQLIITGAHTSFQDFRPQLRAGVEKVLRENPQLKLRYLGDIACSKYVKQHFNFLSKAYDTEIRGAFRGDICRTVVLFNEGGYYMDLDLDIRTPLNEFVDNETTFVSAFSITNAAARQRMYGGSLLNALMIAVPKSKILASTLYHMISWYKGDPSVPWGRTDLGIYVGTLTLWRGLERVLSCNCRERNLDRLWFAMKNETKEVPLQWSCGQESIRLYMEKKINCTTVGDECSEQRKNSTFDLVKYGIFAPGPARNLVAWSRPAWCTTAGCDSGGHNDTGFQTAFEEMQ